MIPNLSDWIEVKPDDWRRYWYTSKPVLTDGESELDLAAITGKPAKESGFVNAYSFRVFNPEGEAKWIREGDSSTVEDAKDQADRFLRAMYGVPLKKQDGQ